MLGCGGLHSFLQLQGPEAGTCFLSLGESWAVSAMFIIIHGERRWSLLQTFSLNQTDHSFAAGFDRKQESIFSPPLLRGTQDRPDLHTQHAPLIARVLAKTHQQQARHPGARGGVYKNCPDAYFSPPEIAFCLMQVTNLCQNLCLEKLKKSIYQHHPEVLPFNHPLFKPPTSRLFQIVWDFFQYIDIFFLFFYFLFLHLLI